MPWIAATTSFGLASIARITSCNDGPVIGLPNSVISAPAMKVRPAQASTMARTLPSCPAFSMPERIPSRTAADSAFTGGEFTVSTATPSCVVRSVTAFISVILGP